MALGALAAAAELDSYDMHAVHVDHGEVAMAAVGLYAALAGRMAKLYDLPKALEGRAAEAFLFGFPFLRLQLAY